MADKGLNEGVLNVTQTSPSDFKSDLFNVSVNVFDAAHYEDGEECNDEPIGFADGYCNGPFHRFKGWDYTELLWKWNMPERDDYDDPNRESPNIELIKFFIKRILYREYGKRLTYFDKRVIKDLRLHVKALSKFSTGYENFWKGIYETKDDDVFLSIMETNIASAWS